jgi:hypothetical protein
MGFEVEIHNTYFVHDEDDDKWIPEVSARKWVILSGDKRLSVEPLNKEAVRSSNAQVLLVTDTNSLPEQWAASIIVGRYRIQELLDKHPGPVFIKIGKQAREHVNVAKEHLLGSQPQANRGAVSSDREDKTSDPGASGLNPDGTNGLGIPNGPEGPESGSGEG